MPTKSCSSASWVCRALFSARSASNDDSVRLPWFSFLALVRPRRANVGPISSRIVRGGPALCRRATSKNAYASSRRTWSSCEGQGARRKRHADAGVGSALPATSADARIPDSPDESPTRVVQTATSATWTRSALLPCLQPAAYEALRATIGKNLRGAPARCHSSEPLYLRLEQSLPPNHCAKHAILVNFWGGSGQERAHSGQVQDDVKADDGAYCSEITAPLISTWRRAVGADWEQT